MSIKEKIYKIEPRVGSVRFMAIDGHGGSGKSTLAEILAEELSAEIIHTDDFAGWDNPENWWPLMVKLVFQPISKGTTVLDYPRSKWWENHNPEPVVNQPVTDIMILEGVGSLRKEFRPYLSFGVFVDTPINVCVKRGLERDKGQDGKSDEEIVQMWHGWYKQEESYIKRDNPKQYADIVLDGTIPFDAQLT
jgi:uridine kinase